MAEDRRVLSNDEFLELKARLRWSDELNNIFYCIIREIYGFSNDEFKNLILDKDIFFTEEDFLPEEGVSYKDIIKKYPEEIQNLFKEIEEKIRKLNISLEDLLTYSETDEFDDLLEKENNQIEKFYEDERMKVYPILNNSDLSQVLPESFYYFPELHLINLENSGANLDMDNFADETKIVGPIKGCHLISYNRNAHKEKFYFYDLYNNEWKKHFDDSQKLVYYKGCLRCGVVPYGVELTIEEHSNMIDEYNTFFNKDNISTYVFLSLLQILPPEIVNESWMERVIQDSLKKNDMDLFIQTLYLPSLSVSLLKKHLNNIIALYRKRYYKIEDVYGDFWEDLPNEGFQIDLIDDIYEEIVLNEKYKEIDEMLMHYSKSDKVKAKIVDKHRDESGKIKASEIELTEYLFRIHDNELLAEILESYEETYGVENLYTQISNSHRDWVFIPWQIQEKYLKKFFEYGFKDGNIDPSNLMLLTENLTIDVYNDLISILEGRILTESSDPVKNKLQDSYKYLTGKFYIKFFGKRFISEDIEDNKRSIIKALITKYNLSNIPSINEHSLENIPTGHLKELLMIANYNEDNKLDEILIKENFWSVLNNLLLFSEEDLTTLRYFRKEKLLNKANFETIMDGIPKLGKNIIDRVFKNGSQFISQNGNIILKRLSTDISKAEDTLEEIENIFSKRNVPNFIKFYKYFELLGYDESKINFENNKLSPVLLSSKSRSYSKRIIFSDLFRIAIDSNSKTLRDFIKDLKEGNEIYELVMINGKDKDSLSETDKQKALKYIDIIYSLYEISDARKVDEREKKSLKLTGNIKEDFEILGKRYSLDGKIRDLPNRILKQFIGPYQHLFDGIDTVDKIEKHMKAAEKANHKRNYDQDVISLKAGDLIHASSLDLTILQSILEDGLRAGEFLGYDSHSDNTPLDTDFSIILPEVEEKSVWNIIDQSSSSTNRRFDYCIIRCTE